MEELAIIRSASGAQWMFNDGAVFGSGPVADGASVVAARHASSGAVTFHIAEQDQPLVIAGNDTFQLVDADDGMVALRTRDGHFLHAGEDGRIGTAPAQAGESTSFRIEEQSEWLAMLGQPCNCCGTKPEVGIVWDDKQHERILDGALIALGSIPKEWGGLYHNAQRITALMPAMKKQIKKGLCDADYDPEYTGTYLGQQVYYMHFYDPTTGKSFIHHNDYPENGRTQCEHYFNRSLRHGPPEMMEQDAVESSAYEFGLALHYLTDLTQPMHACNFKKFLAYNDVYPYWIPRVNAADVRHSSFETYADTFNFGVRPSFTIQELDPSAWGGAEGAGRIAHEVAACSRRIYDKGLRHIVDTTHAVGSFEKVSDPYITECIDHAFFHTAMFFLYWAQKLP